MKNKDLTFRLTPLRNAIVAIGCVLFFLTSSLRAGPALGELFLDDPKEWSFADSPQTMDLTGVAPGSNKGLEWQKGRGLRFVSEGMGLAWKKTEVGTADFAFTSEIEIESGTNVRSRAGFFVGLCSSEPARMESGKDMAVLFAVHQAGVAPTVRCPNVDYINRQRKTAEAAGQAIGAQTVYPYMPNAWALSSNLPPFSTLMDKDPSPRNVLSGHIFDHYQTLDWRNKSLAGTRLKLEIRRTEKTLRFLVFDPGLPQGSAAVLDKSWDLPEKLAGVRLEYLVAGTILNPGDYKDLTRLDAGKPRLAGWIRSLQIYNPSETSLPKVTSATGPQGLLEAGGGVEVHGENIPPGSKLLAGGKLIELAAGPGTLSGRLPLDLGKNHRLPASIVTPSGLAADIPGGLAIGRFVSDVQPRGLSPAGGDLVMILGGGLGRETKVLMDGKPAEVVRVAPNSGIEVKTPPGKPGRAAVRIEHAGVALPGEFTVAYAAHPSLIYKSQAELNGWKKQFADPQFADYREAILGSAERALRTPVDRGNGRATANPITVLLWSYLLTAEPRYREGLFKWLEAVLSRRGVDDYSFMETGAVAVVYDSLFAELTAEQKQRFEAYLTSALEDHVKQRGGYFLEQTFNSQVTMNASAGIAALAMRGVAPDKLVDGTLIYVQKKMKDWAGEMVTPDGAYREGTLYWYSIPYFLMFAKSLETATGSDGGLMQLAGLDRFQNFIAVIIGGDDSMVTFGDTQPWLAGIAQAAGIGSKYHQPFLLGVADRIARENARAERVMAPAFLPIGRDAVRIPEDILKASLKDPSRVWPVVSDRGSILPYGFLWRGTEPPAAHLNLPTLATLDVVQWGVMRSSSRDPKLVIQTKGRGTGLLQFHEIHQDAGSFLLQSNGESFLIDPGYFPQNSFDGYTALNHTVPVIDDVAPAGGRGGGRSGPELASLIHDAWEKNGQRGLTTDSTLPYSVTAQKTVALKSKDGKKMTFPIGPEPRRVRRVFAMNGGEGVVILDDIVPGTGAAGEVMSRFQTGHATTWDPEKKQALITGLTSSLRIVLDGPEMKVGIRGPNDFMNSWIFAPYAKAGFFSWQTIEAAYKADESRPLVAVMQPVLAGQEPATISRGKDEIIVTFQSGSKLRFQKSAEGWKSSQHESDSR